MSDEALITLLCTILDRLPGWTWRPSGGDYTDADGVAIFYGDLRALPDTAVGVRLYGWDDDPITGLAVRRVQLRFRGIRGSRSGADNLASLAFAAFQNLSRVGGVSDVSRISAAPLGADGNGREERTDNYNIILDNLEASS